MIRSDVSVVALSSLFAALLVGCGYEETGCEGYVPQENTVLLDLPRADYEALMTGGMTTGGSTAGETTTDGSTSDGSTTSDPTGGEGLSDAEICAQVCTANYGEAPVSCSVAPKKDDPMNMLVSCVYLSICIGGRGHEGVRSCGAAAGVVHSGAAAWVARATHDEGASVRAFEALARELAALDAPAALVAALEAAASDEVRHAATMGALGERFAAPVVAVEFFWEDQPRRRSLVEIAVENAVEGCVHETWAALVAAHQGRAAGSPELRVLFGEIAGDEARHAALAWAIDGWLVTQLTAAEQATVAAARRAAVERLLAGAPALLSAVDAEGRALLGLPSAAAARGLARGLDAALWSAAA
jgi:hypothetical protein